jgi:hypothetical protein
VPRHHEVGQRVAYEDVILVQVDRGPHHREPHPHAEEDDARDDRDAGEPEVVDQDDHHDDGQGRQRHQAEHP